MNALLEWFASFSDVISSVMDWFGGLIKDLINLVKMLGQAASVIPQLFTMLPGALTGALVAGLAIAILFKVLGREG